MRHTFDVAIIGGMGPLATAELVRRVYLYTDAKKDLEHPSLCVFSAPDIPDRSEYILSNQSKRRKPPFVTEKKHQKSRSNAPATPLKAIKRQIRLAKKLHCRYFAIGCNTAHYFYRDYEKTRGIRFINAVKDTLNYVFSVYPKRDVCVLATLGTVKADIYGSISPKGTKINYPSPSVCGEIMELIRDIKAGQVELSDSDTLPCDKNFSSLLSHLKEEFDTEKTVFILGCTELSLIADYFKPLTAVDSTDVLAGRIISVCEKKLNTKGFKLKTEFFEE